MQPLGSSGQTEVSVLVGKRNVRVKVRPHLWRSDLGVVVEPAEYGGMILVPRWEELINLLRVGQSRRLYRWRADALRYQLVRSVYAAIRQTEHILAGYGLVISGGEKALVLQAREAALAANRIALGLRAGTVDETATDLKAVAGQVIRRLGQPRDLPKREGGDYLTKLASARDARGRANPAVTMVRAVAASERFRERLEEGIMCIEPLIVMRQRALLNLHELAWYTVDIALRFVVDLVKILEGDRLVFLRNRVRIEQSKRRLQQLAADLARIDFHPYLIPLGFVVDELRTAARALPQRPDDAVRLARRSRESLRLCGYQVELQRLILILTRIGLGTRDLAVAADLEPRLEKLRQSLTGVRDEDFRFRVRVKLLQLLDRARPLLVEPTMESCSAARDLLKEAGEVLAKPPSPAG